MTERFLAAVTEGCADYETVAIGCLGEHCEHADGDENHSCETHFSWRQCDSCGSTFGGDRSEAYGLYRSDRTDKLEHARMDICVDCIMYHANGEAPDEWYQHPDEVK